jgi:hypothetical protein
MRWETWAHKMGNVKCCDEMPDMHLMRCVTSSQSTCCQPKAYKLSMSSRFEMPTCVCVCERERERVRASERERERARARERRSVPASADCTWKLKLWPVTHQFAKCSQLLRSNWHAACVCHGPCVSSSAHVSSAPQHLHNTRTYVLIDVR